MHVTATVYDGTSYGGWNTEKVAGQLKSDIEEAFTADTQLAEFRVDAQITTTDDKSKEVIGNQHLFEIRDASDKNFKQYPGKRFTGGISKRNGKHTLINERFLEGLSNKNVLNVSGHEFGHLAGLVHPSEDYYVWGLIKGSQYMENDKGNMMYKNATYSRNLTLKQIMTVYKKWNSGQLNQNIFYKD